MAQNGPFANGTQVPGYPASLVSFDARSGMVLSKKTADFTQDYNPTGSVGYAYDAAGRQTVVTNTYTYGSTVTAYATRSYDAENHVVSQAYTGATFACADSLSMCGNQMAGNNPGVSSGAVNTYGWGPNGHPIKLLSTLNGSPYLYQGWSGFDPVSIHWDGDDVLFASTTSGSQDLLLDVEIGKLGTMNGSAIYVEDRDMSGEQVATHNSTQFSAWTSPAPSKNLTCVPCKSQNGYTYITGAIPSSGTNPYDSGTQILGAGRTDGYDDTYGNVFQGVRAYDPNAGQWTAPDAYAGDVHDPMSQKPFMWNRNNAIAYSDPNGYCPVCEILVEVLGLAVEASESAEMAEVGAAAIEEGATVSRAAQSAASFARSAENSSTALRNTAESLFRDEDKLPGGTANAIRVELATGEKVNGKFHLEKGANSIRRIQNLLEGGSLSKTEREAAEAMLKDLKDAFGKLNPDGFLRNNQPPPIVPKPQPAPAPAKPN